MDSSVNAEFANWIPTWFPVVVLITRTADAENDITRIGAGWLMGMAILILLFYPLTRNRKWQRALVIFLLPLFLAGLMASAARGPMVAVGIAVLIGVAKLLKDGTLRLATALILLFILVTGIGGAYLVLRQTDLGKYTAKAGELEVLFTQGSSSGSAGKRVDFYRATLAALLNQPLIGTGIGSWSTFYFGNDQRNYPHNLFLEIAFEQGLVGLAAFLTLLALVGVATNRMIRASRSHFLVLGLLILYCAIISMFSGDLDDNRLLWMWIGVTLAVCRLVQLRVQTFRSMQRAAARRAPAAAPRPYGAPAFPGHFAPEKYSLQKKGRAWREKFVF